MYHTYGLRWSKLGVWRHCGAPELQRTLAIEIVHPAAESLVRPHCYVLRRRAAERGASDAIVVNRERETGETNTAARGNQYPSDWSQLVFVGKLFTDRGVEPVAAPSLQFVPPGRPY